ncbi:hypothetical protein D3C72_1814930 [compost metagenome]
MKTAKTPAKPRIVNSKLTSTCGFKTVRSSFARSVASFWLWVFGTKNSNAAIANGPIAVTAQNVERQPKLCPSQVPNGTPKIFATVRPVNIKAMALARWLGFTKPVATTEPIPKKVPWAKEVTTRAIIKVI